MTRTREPLRARRVRWAPVVLFALLGGLLPAARAEVATVTGRVTNEQGEPVAGAWLRLSNYERPARRSPEGETSDRDGRYAFARVPAGVWAMQIKAEAHQFYYHEGVRVEDGKPLRFDPVLQRGVALTIAVRAADGSLVPGRLRLSLEAAGEGRRVPYSPQWDYRVEETGPGFFQARSLPALPVTVRLRTEQAPEVEVVIDLSDGTPRGVTLVPPPGLWIEGTVVDDTGAPLPGVRVHVGFVSTPDDGPWRYRVQNAESTRELKTDEQGCFRLGPLRESVWTVAVDGTDETLRNECRAGESVTLIIPRPASLEGRVTLPSGRVPLIDGAGRIGGLPVVLLHALEHRPGMTGIPAASVAPEGTYRFTRLRPGAYEAMVYVRDARLGARSYLAEPVTLTVRPGEAHTQDFVLTRAATLAGRLRFPPGAGGEFCSHLRLLAWDAEAWPAVPERLADRPAHPDRGYNDASVQLWPDADGTFRTELLPAGRYHLGAVVYVYDPAASAYLRVTELFTREFAPGTTTEGLEVPLRAACIAGTVRAADAGVKLPETIEVFAWPLDAEPPPGGAAARAWDSRYWVGKVGLPTGQAGADGRFYCRPLLPGRYEIGVGGWNKYRYPGTWHALAPVQVRTFEAGVFYGDLDFTVAAIPEALAPPSPPRPRATAPDDPAQGLVTGRVTDEQGRPVPGASVAVDARASWPRGDRIRWIDPLREATADAQGRFRIDRVPPGAHEVAAAAPGARESERRSFTVSAERREHVVDLVLRRGQRLTLHVRDSWGVGIDDAPVTLRRYPPSREEAPPFEAEATTDRNGRCVFAGLKPGTYLIAVEDPDPGRRVDREAKAGGMSYSVTLDPGEDAEAVVPWLRTGRRGVRLSGRLRNAGGPVAGRKLMLTRRWSPMTFAPRTDTDQEGRYVFDGLPPGSYLLEAGEDLLGLITIGTEPVTFDVAADAPDAAAFGRLTVQVDQGRPPVAEDRFRVTLLASGFRRTAALDGQGRCEFAALPPGPAEIAVTAPDDRSSVFYRLPAVAAGSRATLTVPWSHRPDGAEAPVQRELVALQCAGPAGRVRGPTGYVCSVREPRGYSALPAEQLGADGRSELRLPPGEYFAVLTDPDWAFTVTRFTVAAREHPQYELTRPPNRPPPFFLDPEHEWVDEKAQVVDVMLTPGVPVALDVRDEAGRPIAGAAVELLTAEGEFPVFAQLLLVAQAPNMIASGLDGRLAVMLPPGPVRLRVRHAEYAAVEVAVAPGGPPIVVRLPRR